MLEMELQNTLDTIIRVEMGLAVMLLIGFIYIGVVVATINERMKKLPLIYTKHDLD